MNKKTLRVLEYHKIIELLVEQTVSDLGKEIALSLKPSSDIYEVKEWLQETGEAVNILLKKGSFPFEGIHDIRGALKKAEIESTLELGELLKVSYTLAGARKIKAFMKEEKSENIFPIIEDLTDLLIDFRDIENSINNAIINDEEISDKASPELYSTRKKIREKQIQIKEKMNYMITSPTYQKYLQEQIVTIRGDRYVLPVKQEFRGNVPGIVHDQSSSGATLYIEPMFAVQMNNDLRQLKLKEQDEIIKILEKLSSMIAEKCEEIRTNLEILTTLDFIFAKAKLSLKLRCIEPLINTEGRINLKKARHPLIDPAVVVPINVHLGNTFNILVITGPNTGGKTVTLKTIGLLTLMAQSGLHIPASDESEIGIFDKVFADIGDEQSIEQSLSTFSSHMKNIISIATEITENSLVLLDELGAGTDPTEGAALAMAILELLREKHIRTVATTHYSELKVYALTTPSLCNGSVEFDVETLQPTYKLSIGIPGKSNAFEISKKLGLDETIIEKAREFIAKDKIKFEDVIFSLEESRKKADEEKSIAQKLRYEAEKYKLEAEKRMDGIIAQKEKILKEAHIEAEGIIDKYKIEINELVKELKEAAEKEAEEKLSIVEKSRIRIKNIESKLDENITDATFKKIRRHKPPKELKLGDLVRIVNLDQKGDVMTLPDENGNLIVQAGIIKINVNIKDLQLEENKKNEITQAKYAKIGKSKALSVPLELDIRGETLDEALMNVDKYLDDVYLSGIKNITIIHGKGTGVLRSGISQLLKNHPHVKSFRSGGYHEGGLGATIVEIKQ